MLPLPFRHHTTYPGHSGVDFPEPFGTPVRASGAGTVTRAGWINDRAGFGVIVAYDGGPDVLYCHFAEAFYPASRVTLGSMLGRVGSTGNSTGPHLHMEIMRGRGAHTYNGIWHHFDRNSVVGDSIPVGGESNQLVEGDETVNAGVYYNLDNATIYLIFNTDSGWFHEFSNGAGNGPMPGEYNNSLARALGTPSWASVTAAHAKVLKESLLKIQGR